MFLWISFFLNEAHASIIINNQNRVIVVVKVLLFIADLIQLARQFILHTAKNIVLQRQNVSFDFRYA